MVDRRRLLTGAVGLGALALAGCTRGDDEPRVVTPSEPAPSPSATTSAPPDPRVAGTVTDGLNVPWAIVFLPGGDALVSQRDEGTVVRVAPDGTTTTLGGVSGSRGGAGGEAGLLGLAIDPDDATRLFAYQTTASDNRVVTMRLDGDRLVGQEPVLTGIPVGSRHQGGALLFAPDGTLFVATGEAGDPPLAQDPDSLGGKVLRIRRDGSAVEGADSRVWSLGHRNVEGLALDDGGELWASEFGERTSDELNRIERGGNYGWPEVEGEGGPDRFVQPVVTWPTDQCSPAGLAITRSTAFLAALRGECLWSVPLTGDGAGEPVRLFEGEHGRLRSVAVAPDGSLWVGTSNTDGRGDVRDGDDRILRVTL